MPICQNMIFPVSVPCIMNSGKKRQMRSVKGLKDRRLLPLPGLNAAKAKISL